MQISSRRQFLQAGAAAFACSRAAALAAEPLGMPPGCQIFPVRQQLVKDFDGTLKELAGAGYRVIEFCSPPGFVTMDLAPLVDMKASEIRKRAKDAGLQIVSCHYQFKEMKEHVDERIEFARQLGLKQMVVATLAIPATAPLDEWRRAADDMNKLGEKTQKAGIELGFHNHGFEFRKLDGVLIFDELMSRFDKKLVKSQFQVSIVSQGFDPAEFVEKYPGRFVSLHLQDWSATTKRQVPVGQGAIDWKKLFTAAKKANIKYYFVEMNMDALKASYPFLHALKV